MIVSSHYWSSFSGGAPPDVQPGNFGDNFQEVC
jgi:hypothetical protein